jgi:hypothetical protein
MTAEQFTHHLAAILRQLHPEASDEAIFQTVARLIVAFADRMGASLE